MKIKRKVLWAWHEGDHMLHLPGHVIGQFACGSVIGKISSRLGLPDNVVPALACVECLKRLDLEPLVDVVMRALSAVQSRGGENLEDSLAAELGSWLVEMKAKGGVR